MNNTQQNSVTRWKTNNGAADRQDYRTVSKIWLNTNSAKPDIPRAVLPTMLAVFICFLIVSRHISTV